MHLMDTDRDANLADTISEQPVKSETTEPQSGPSGPSALKVPRLSDLTQKRNPPLTGQ